MTLGMEDAVEAGSLVSRVSRGMLVIPTTLTELPLMAINLMVRTSNVESYDCSSGLESSKAAMAYVARAASTPAGSEDWTVAE